MTVIQVSITATICDESEKMQQERMAQKEVIFPLEILSMRDSHSLLQAVSWGACIFRGVKLPTLLMDRSRYLQMWCKATVQDG